ncbi:MAG: F0F1 ATP synthase subunit epsilon [Acidobacteriaceae bacterium]|nr:F0F1 ATP synthase subunit epsilon [Acidobacteriaceae bacterium]
MALPTTLHLHIASSDRSLVDETVDEVQIPGVQGYFGVLPGHTPLLAQLSVGDLWYRQGSETHHLAMAYGFAEVQPDRVTILAETAESADEIDEARAEAAKRRAEERLRIPNADIDIDRASVALKKAIVRIQVSQRARAGV